MNWNWLDVIVYVPKWCVMIWVTECIWCMLYDLKWQLIFVWGLYPINITWWIHACSRGMQQNSVIYICVDVFSQYIHVFIAHKFINIINNKYWSV